MVDISIVNGIITQLTTGGAPPCSLSNFRSFTTIDLRSGSAVSTRRREKIPQVDQDEWLVKDIFLETCTLW